MTRPTNKEHFLESSHNNNSCCTCYAIPHRECNPPKLMFYLTRTAQTRCMQSMNNRLHSSLRIPLQCVYYCVQPVLLVGASLDQGAAANKTFLQPTHCIGCKHTAQLLMQADTIQIFLINSPPSASSPAWRSSQVKDLLPLCKRRLGDALGARRAKHTCLKLTFPQDTRALYFSPSH